MAATFVDPHRHLGAKGRWHGVLAVGAPRQQHVFGALRQVGHGAQDGRQLCRKISMGATQQQELTGLRDVLRRGAPVHVAAGVALTDAVQLPDQRHERMAGARQSGVEVVQIE